MKSHHIFILVLCITAGLCYKNTTAFWAKQLNLTKLNYQAYSGYQEIDWYYPQGKSGMFYNFFGAMGYDPMQVNEDIPLIIWLQGGPGSSSQFGAFTQIGPIKIEKGVPKQFHLSWNNLGHTLFIDSPLNAGFSFQGDRKGKSQVSTTTQATNHLLNFLFNFYNQFKSLRNCPLYIAGQSFAGHYIPNFARKILTNSSFIKATGVRLAGISIGDGWVDPVNQGNYYDSYLWSLGVIDAKFRDVCNWCQTQSMRNIFEGNYQNATNFFDFLMSNDTNIQVNMGNVSIYNFRNYDGLDESFAGFLQRNKMEFGSSVQFISANDYIYTAFGGDMSRSYAQDLISCLRDVKVLIYNGQNDIVVNSPGVLHYLNALTWQGISSWKNKKKHVWKRFGEVKGWAKVSGNLWFVMVNGAGHMVPTDQPESAYQMLGNFIHNHDDWNL